MGRLPSSVKPLSTPAGDRISAARSKSTTAARITDPRRPVSEMSQQVLDFFVNLYDTTVQVLSREAPQNVHVASRPSLSCAPTGRLDWARISVQRSECPSLSNHEESRTQTYTRKEASGHTDGHQQKRPRRANKKLICAQSEGQRPPDPRKHVPEVGLEPVPGPGNTGKARKHAESGPVRSMYGPIRGSKC